jgi:hypothetical protein
VSRPSASSSEDSKTLSIGSAREWVLKAASDCMRGHPQEKSETLKRTVDSLKFDGLLMPFEHLTYLPIGQFAR